MTSSCIRLVWQPIQHKDRQRAESGETDSWVAANRQGGPTRLDKIKNFHLAVQARGVGPGEYRRRLTLWGSPLTEAIGAYHPCYRRRIISPDRREPGATLEMYIDIGDPDATMSQSRYYDDMTTPRLRPTSPAQCGTFSSSSAWPEVRERGDSRGASTVRGLPPRRC